MRILAPTFLAFFAFFGAARGAELEKIDPREIRFVDMTDSTSTCIGDPRTPLCAVETVIACDVRPSVCAVVRSPFVPPASLKVEYRILRIAPIDKKKAEAALKADAKIEFGSWPWLSLDTVFARVEVRQCTGLDETISDDCDFVPWMEIIVAVSPHHGAWRYDLYEIFSPDDWFAE